MKEQFHVALFRVTNKAMIERAVSAMTPILNHCSSTRCVNLTDEEIAGAWRLGFPVKEARLSRLDETAGGPLAMEVDRVSFVALPHAEKTMLLRWRDGVRG